MYINLTQINKTRFTYACHVAYHVFYKNGVK